MSEVMWVWDYELKTLGSWPSTGYNGHNTPVEVVTQMDVKALRDERDRLRDELDVYRQAVQYVFEAINKFDDIQRKKAALTPAGGENETV